MVKLERHIFDPSLFMLFFIFLFFYKCLLVLFYEIKQRHSLTVTEVSKRFLGPLLCARYGCLYGLLCHCLTVWALGVVGTVGFCGEGWHSAGCWSAGPLVKGRCYVAEVHSFHLPVCLSGISPGWARGCDDADRMTAGTHRGECQCGRDQFLHDLLHIQTHSQTHTHTEAYLGFSKECGNIWWYRVRSLHLSREFNWKFLMRIHKAFSQVNKILCSIELLEFETNTSSILIDLETQCITKYKQPLYTWTAAGRYYVGRNITKTQEYILNIAVKSSVLIKTAIHVWIRQPSTAPRSSSDTRVSIVCAFDGEYGSS